MRLNRLLLVICLLAIVFGPAVVLGVDSGTPTRTWFLHGRRSPGGGIASLTMSELRPEGGSDPILQTTDFGATTRFILSQTYQFGFDILQGTAFIEFWMRAYVRPDPCCFALPPLNAEFDFKLATAAGKPIGSTVETIVFRDWQMGGTSSEFLAWNHTSVSLPISSALSLEPDESAYLEMTWLNRTREHTITLFFNSEVYPTGLRIPANYYSSSLTLQSSSTTARLGDVVHLQGSLMNTWNNSSIRNQKITLTAHVVGPGDQRIPIGEVSTSETGEYSYDWPPPYWGNSG